MTNIAAKTRGIGIDYRWQKENPDAAETYKSLEAFSDNSGLSIVLTRADDAFHCLVSGILTSQHDRTNMRIRLALFYGGMDENEARRLVYAFLSAQEANSIALLTAFEWKKDASEGDWTVDFPKLKDAVSKIINSVSLKPDGEPFSDAWERKRTPDGERALAEEILSHPFSEADGVKLVVADAPQGYSQICEEADRLLWSQAVERELKLNFI